MDYPKEPGNPWFPRLHRRNLLAGGVLAFVAPVVAVSDRRAPTLAAAQATPGTSPTSPRPDLADYPYASHYAEVLGSRLHYLDEGAGRALIFLNDNPSWSYIWRHVLPYVRGGARCIALDYLGTGLSDKPVSAYNYWTHLNHLEAFVEALGLEQVAFVGHGWGTALATSYARRHPDRAAGLAWLETFWIDVARAGGRQEDLVRPDTQEGDIDPEMAAWFYPTCEALRGVLDDNAFLKVLLPRYVKRGLTPAEHAGYLAPYPAREDRLAMLRFFQSIPIDGRNPDVLAEFGANLAWLQQENTAPVLLIYSPEAITPEPMAIWIANNVPGVEVVAVPDGYNHFQEDHPEVVGKTLARFAASLPAG